MPYDDPDDPAAYNRERWNELATRGVEFARPVLDLNPGTARRMIDPQGALGDPAGRRVLCLAAGGGQQSAAFGVLGAEVTVLDFSPVQLERDRLAGEHYGRSFRLEEGDMRDLSRFEDESFDIVWQAHSINFVPGVGEVFSEVTRVLSPGGAYRLEFTNPFILGTWEDSWTGTGYLVAGPYRDGEVRIDGPWTFDDEAGKPVAVDGPREFRHTFGTIVNGLTAAGLAVAGLWEDVDGDLSAAAGSWEHFRAFAAPWILVVARKPGP